MGVHRATINAVGMPGDCNSCRVLDSALIQFQSVCVLPQIGTNFDETILHVLHAGVTILPMGYPGMTIQS
ncbi:hypothetical protein SK128_023530, partial [Halocaridina rubra]